MIKLENLVKNVTGIALAGTLYGCVTPRVHYPVQAALRQLEKAAYCIENQTVQEIPCQPYPLIQIDFKDP